MNQIKRIGKQITMNNKKEIKQVKDTKLILLPKTERYIQYILELLIKLPRTEKFSIGNEYKTSMYQMLQDILIIHKIQNKEIMNYLNKIDASLNTQRIYLRIMKKNYWIDEKKFKIAMDLIYEIGKILGGLIKYYAQNNTK